MKSILFRGMCGLKETDVVLGIAGFFEQYHGFEHVVNDVGLYSFDGEHGSWEHQLLAMVDEFGAGVDLNQCVLPLTRISTPSPQLGHMTK